jgi:hypothetical protein
LCDGKRVELIKTEKVSGKNVQISYIREYDGWIICSNYVSLLAVNSNDLELYNEQRYQFLLLIADQWFKDISKLPNNKVTQLKKLLDGFTAIGSLCGHPDYQRIVRYDEIQLRWFAMVDNNS